MFVYFSTDVQDLLTAGTLTSPIYSLGSPASSSGIESGGSNPPSPIMMEDVSASDSGNESPGLSTHGMMDRGRMQLMVFMLAVFAFNPLASFLINSNPLGGGGGDYVQVHDGGRMLKATGKEHKSMGYCYMC